jgi:hypothetical protein
MSIRSRLDQLDTVTLLRRGILVLAALGTVGAAMELLLLKHWTTVGMVFGWVDIGACLVAVVLAAGSSGRAIVAARWLAVLGLVLAAVGIGLHVHANWEAGPADGTLGAVWATLPLLERLWDAATGVVGKAPPLAPGALAEASLLVLLATVRHPALGARRAV